MRYLFILDGLGSGGAQRQMTALALEFARRGAQVKFFTYSPADHFAPMLAAAGIERSLVEKRSRWDLRPVAKLAQEMRSFRPDGVVAFLDTPSAYAAVAKLLARVHCPLVVSERFFDPPTGPGFAQSGIRHLFRLADFVVVNSRHQTQNFANRYPWMKSRLRTILNGVDLDVFAKTARPAKTGVLRILGIGSVSPHKNIETLISAVRDARDSYGLRMAVSWAGAHVQTLPDRRRYLEVVKTLVEESGLQSIWTWLGERKDVHTLFRDTDVLVHPSVGEGTPNVICEALASGVPVIASNVLDHPHLVREPFGSVFSALDSSELALRLVEFSKTSDGDRCAMADAARSFAATNLSLQRMADEYEQLLTS